MAIRGFTLLAAPCIAILLGSGVLQSAAVAQSSEIAAFPRFDRQRDLNLGLATTDGMLVDGPTAVFTVSERAQQRDLNQDGDLDDNIVHVFNALTGRVRNLGLNRGPGEVPALLQGRVLAVWAREGATDLNGDGDTVDAVLHVYDTLLGTLRNLRLAGSPFGSVPFIKGRRMAFGVEESAQGQDLNRDGDTSDEVPHLFDISTGRIQSIGLSVGFTAPTTLTLAGRWLAVGVDEGSTVINADGTVTENRDLNDNGSNVDTVLHLFDTVTGEAKNLRVVLGAGRGFDPEGFEIGFDVGPSEGLLALAEFRQGITGQGLDLNGDGDMFDTVLHRVDLAAGLVTNTRIAMESGGQDAGFPSFGSAPPPFAFQEGLAVFNVNESDRGRDLNGDGDRDDVVLQALSTRTWLMRSLNVSASLLFLESLSGRAVVFMSETLNGKDLNSDGDIDESEFVVGLADLRGSQPRIVNTGLALSALPTNGDDLTFLLVDAFALQIRDNRVSFIVPEQLQGNRDLNGDGDTTDNVLHIADLSTFTTLNTGLSGAFAYRALQAPLFPASEGRGIVPVSETRQGNRDLNHDGDTQDIVLQSIDVRTGSATNTNVAIAADTLGIFTIFRVPLAVRGETFVALLVDERTVDLNSDGDTADRVLQLLDIATGRITNVGLASGSPKSPRSASDDDFTFVGRPISSGSLSGFDGGGAGADGPGLGDAFVFIVSEADQGNIDLNGDGDTDDRVVHATRLTDRDRNGRFDFAEQ